MKSNRLFWIVPLSAVILGVLFWFFVLCPQQAGLENPVQEKAPPLVKVQPVQQTSITSTMELTGEVVAGNSTVISSMKEGRIEFCPWREGDTVKSGDTLVMIDREIHRAEAQAARAAYNLARARLEDLIAGTRPEEIRKASANLKRFQVTYDEALHSFERQSELFNKGIASQDTLDKAREQMEVAEADVAAAEDTLAILEAGPTGTETAVQRAAVKEAAARLDLAEAHLAEFVVTAPFSGTISKVHVRPGDIASPREPLVELFDPASLLIRFTVPEAQVAWMQMEMTLDVSMDAVPGKTYSAKVSRIYPELDPILRTCTVEAVTDQPAEMIPYMFARLTLRTAQAEDALVVPADAVLVLPNGKRILYVIEDGKAAQRRIVIGIEDGARVQVISGIDTGDMVAVAGNEMLKPGMAVRLAQAQEKPKKQGDQGAFTGSKEGNRP